MLEWLLAMPNQGRQADQRSVLKIGKPLLSGLGGCHFVVTVTVTPT